MWARDGATSIGKRRKFTLVPTDIHFFARKRKPKMWDRINLPSKWILLTANGFGLGEGGDFYHKC